MSSQPEHMTPAELATQLTVPEETVRDYIEWGELEANHDVHITKAQVEAFERARAYHEAGHVLVARSLDWTVLEASIVLGRPGGPSSPMAPPQSSHPTGKSPEVASIEDRIRVVTCYENAAVIAAAGREAQQLGTGRYPDDRVLDGDVETIMAWARRHPELKSVGGLKALKARGAEARKLLVALDGGLERLAKRLLEKKTIRNELECELQGRA